MWMTGWASHTFKGRGNTWLGVLLLTWEKNQATCGVTKGSDFLETNLFVLFVLKEKTYFDSHSFRCFFSFTYLLLPYHWSLIQCSSVQCLFIFLLALLFSHTRLSKSRVHQSRQNRLVACLNIIVITCTNASNSCYSFFFFFLPALEFNQNFAREAVVCFNCKHSSDHYNLRNKQRSRDSGVKIILQPESASMPLSHRYQGNASTGMRCCGLRTVIYSRTALV